MSEEANGNIFFSSSLFSNTAPTPTSNLICGQQKEHVDCCDMSHQAFSSHSLSNGDDDDITMITLKIHFIICSVTAS